MGLAWALYVGPKRVLVEKCLSGAFILYMVQIIDLVVPVEAVY